MQGQADEVEERTYLGSYNAHVAGVNHYRGVVTNGEMVRSRGCKPVLGTAWPVHDAPYVPARSVAYVLCAAVY